MMDAAKVRALEFQKWLVPPKRNTRGMVRVWRIAQLAGVSSGDVMLYMRDLGLTVRSPSAAIEPVLASVVVSRFERLARRG